MSHTYRPSKIAKKTYLYSDEMLLEAVDKLIASVKIDRKYDIPYVAGYNKAGTVVYIDRDVPKDHIFNKKSYNLDKYLVTHEVVEKVFEETLHLNYFYAHQIALRIERQTVEADGLSWSEYDKLMQKYIKEDAHEKIQHVPEDLDFQPYIDGKDYKLINHMKKHLVNESVRNLEFIKYLKG